MKNISSFLAFLLSLLIPMEVVAESYNIVFIGNSITYGALHKHRERTAPPVVCARWLMSQEDIDSVFYVNMGRSGRTTYHFLPDKKCVVPAGDKTYFGDVVSNTRQLVDKHPDCRLIFSIMLGTNDSAERPRNHRTTIDEYVKNITTIIDSLLQRWPNAMFVLQRPIYYTPGIHTQGGSLLDKAGAEMLVAYYKSFRQITYKYPKGVVSVGDRQAYGYFRKHWQTDMFEEQGADGKSFWLHPNEKGAEQLGLYWGKAIKKLLR